MASVTPLAFEDEQLDAQGQNARLNRLYTQLCFCFSLSKTDSQSISHVTDYLTDGLAWLTSNFPWVAGHVVEEGSIFRIKPFEAVPKLTVKDLCDQLPPYSKYLAKGFSFHLLDENVIAPRNTLPEHFDEPAPVLLLQATFITGGVLFVVNGQHNCMDIRGQAQIIYLLAKACRNEHFTEEELQICNLPRADIIPFLEDINDLPAEPMPSQHTPGPDTATQTSDPDIKPQSQWAYFLFSQASLAELKRLAVKSTVWGYVSTDDVLSAFIWQSVTRARLARGSSDTDTDTSTFDRQVDARKFLDIPTSYTGNVVHRVSSPLAMRHIPDMSLGTLALHLRTCLQSTDIAYEVRRAVTKAHQATLAKPSQSSKHTARPNRGTLPPTDLRVSSWAKEDCYDVDFGGLLGKPEAVRRPDFQAWEGLVYFLPKKADGEIAVALCLREEDIERLRHDEEFTSYCSYVG